MTSGTDPVETTVVYLTAAELETLGLPVPKPSRAPAVSGAVAFVASLTTVVVLGCLFVSGAYTALVTRGDPGDCPRGTPGVVAAQAEMTSIGCCVYPPRTPTGNRSVCAVPASLRCGPSPDWWTSEAAIGGPYVECGLLPRP